MRGVVNFFIVFTLTTTLAVAKPVDSDTASEDPMDFKCDGHETRAENHTENKIILQTCLLKHMPATNLQSDATDSDRDKEFSRLIAEIANNTCFILCILQEQKLFDDKGALTTASADSFADSIFTTKESGDKIKAELSTCASKHGQHLSLEDKCVSYKDYFTCINKAFDDMCGKSSARK